MLKNRNQIVEDVKTEVFLTFRLATELFAANVTSVVNILELEQISPVPLSPPHLIGVLNLRGSVLPVIDTRILLQLPISPNLKETSILVISVKVEDEIVDVGALVDAVNEVIEIPEVDILPVVQMGSQFELKFVKGLLKYKNEFITILNVDTLFEIDK